LPARSYRGRERGVIGVFSVGQRWFWLRGVRAIRGFDKNESGKVILVGLGSHACVAPFCLFSLDFGIRG
jgi:hypothetical protein